MLKVAIDAQPSKSQQRTGHGYYVKGLLDGLASVDQIDLVRCYPEASGSLNTPARFLWDQVGLPKMARNSRVDLLHTTAFSVPRFYSGPIVATVHDLALKRFPGNMKGVSGWYLREFVPSTFKYADHLIADSEATKQDAVDFLKIKPRKISVVHLGVDPFFQPSSEVESNKALTKFGLKPNKYFLFVGTLEPRKNIPFLIKAIAPTLKKNPDIKLVLAGKKGWQWESVYTQVESSKLKVQSEGKGGPESNVIVTGYVSDEEKRALYSNAIALSYASSFEGFGMPIVEAFACGCPVISADNSSLPEVVGEAGKLLPLDEVVWREYLAKFISDTKLQAELSKLGLARAKEFTWKKAANKTVEVYKTILGQTL